MIDYVICMICVNNLLRKILMCFSEMRSVKLCPGIKQAGGSIPNVENGLKSEKEPDGSMNTLQETKGSSAYRDKGHGA